MNESLSQAMEGAASGGLRQAVHTASVTNAQVNRIAEVAFGAVRALGESVGEMDLPTWQIARGVIKADYIWAVRWVLNKPEGRLLDLHGAYAAGRWLDADRKFAGTDVAEWKEARFRLFRAVVLVMGEGN